MSDKQQLIGACAQLEEGKKGLRFDVKNLAGDELPAFVVRYNGHYFAYVNRCGHIAIQLDFMPGDFFSDDGQTLMCSTHGAEYAPDTGACLGGPCYGVGLEPISIRESEGRLFLADEKLTVYKKNANEKEGSTI